MLRWSNRCSQVASRGHRKSCNWTPARR